MKPLYAQLLYVLNERGEAVPEPSAPKWAKWLESHDAARLVADTSFPGGVHVSTIFIGIDQHFGRGAPALWETMVFGGPLNLERQRYTSLEDARAGHLQMLDKVKAARP
jgi:hypothetical protein